MSLLSVTFSALSATVLESFEEFGVAADVAPSGWNMRALNIKSKKIDTLKLYIAMVSYDVLSIKLSLAVFKLRILIMMVAFVYSTSFISS